MNTSSTHAATRRAFIGALLTAVPFLSAGSLLANSVETLPRAVPGKEVVPADGCHGGTFGPAALRSVQSGSELLGALHERSLVVGTAPLPVPTVSALRELLVFTSRLSLFDEWLHQHRALLSVPLPRGGEQSAGALFAAVPSHLHPSTLLRLDAAIKHLRTGYYALPWADRDQIQMSVFIRLLEFRAQTPTSELLDELDRETPSGSRVPAAI